MSIGGRPGKSVAVVLGSRGFAIVASIALLVLTLSPVVREPTDDGFPLSTYPMFATERPTELSMVYALGVTRSGERRYLRPFLIGSGEVLQAYMILAGAVAGGPGTTQALCQAIAARIRELGDIDIVTVRIVFGKHDALEVLLDHKLGKETERTRCSVKRS